MKLLGDVGPATAN